MPFFVEGLDLHAKGSITIDYWKFVREVTRASHAVTFVALETLKNVLKPQGAPYVNKTDMSHMQYLDL